MGEAELIAQDRKGGEITLCPYVPHGVEEVKYVG